MWAREQPWVEHVVLRPAADGGVDAVLYVTAPPDEDGDATTRRVAAIVQEQVIDP